MKKIDKLVLGAFLGPFVITFLVVVFILLNIQMLKYFDDIIGKGLDWDVLGQLLFYFAVFTTPTAMPLAVLLSALIAYGNLGEHFELTAVKSAGISLLRTLQPIFIFVLFLTAIAFYVNNNLVPKAALEAYSLLYDIKQKKPALDLREGAFYNGIPDISIKVNQKFPDGETLKDVIIYDHRKNDGNKDVTVADSGRMYTILNERYLKFELFNGYNYTEGAATEQAMAGGKKIPQETVSRSKFEKTQVVFDLSSFNLERTDKKWFEGNRIMRNLGQLDVDIDSIKREILQQRLMYHLNRPSLFTYYGRKDSLVLPHEVQRFRVERDSLARAKYEKSRQESKKKVGQEKDSARQQPLAMALKPAGEAGTPLPGNVASRELPDRPGTADNKMLSIPAEAATADTVRSDSLSAAARHAATEAKIDSVFALKPTSDMVQSAANTARQVKSQVMNSNSGIQNYAKELTVFEIQWHKIIANSLACIAMFLIGAPLGAIIKRGGLGVPFLVAILFFIIFYLLSMQGEKLAKQDVLSVSAGVWAADLVLLVIGLFFLRQARNDARLFEGDFYLVVFDRIKASLEARKMLSTADQGLTD